MKFMIPYYWIIWWWILEVPVDLTTSMPCQGSCQIHLKFCYIEAVQYYNTCMHMFRMLSQTIFTEVDNALIMHYNSLLSSTKAATEVQWLISRIRTCYDSCVILMSIHGVLWTCSRRQFAKDVRWRKRRWRHLTSIQCQTVIYVKKTRSVFPDSLGGNRYRKAHAYHRHASLTDDLTTLSDCQSCIRSQWAHDNDSAPNVLMFIASPSLPSCKQSKP